MLDNFDNLQASWVTQGGKVGQLSLGYGANDMGSVMIEENVVRAAGASYCMDEVEIVRNIEDAGFAAKRRNMHYEILGDPIFREREVPRMLELATARAEGDTSVPEELAELSGAEAGPANGSASFPIDPLPRLLGAAHQRAADSATAGSPSIAIASPRSAIGVPCRPMTPATSISDTWRCCRVSSTRTLISSSRICAIRCRRRTHSSTGFAV